MTDSPLPSIIAMLVCDQIITEQVTNKKSLIGVFDGFVTQRFPVQLPRLTVYVKMADAVGSYQFKVRIVKLKDESLVAELGLQATISDQMQYSELAINIPTMFNISEAGVYEFQLYANDTYLHRVTMRAQLAQLPR